MNKKIKNIQMNYPHTKRKAILFLVLITLTGVSCKFYRGPASNWVNDSLGGLFYVIFWCVLIFLFFEYWKPWLLSLSVCIATCFVEFLQLYHCSFLGLLRSSFIGKTLLGTTFAWSDFPYYIGGSVVGWISLRYLSKSR